jgi:ubiquinone/menaquinone biosynthesis C-methylase UbiE
MVTRWDKWFSDDNLVTDKRILAAPPSQSAVNAGRMFVARHKRFILDLACGIGRDTFYLESCGLEVIGVDASAAGLRAALQNGAKWAAVAKLAMADARHLPFRDGSFEGVFCFGLLHEFTDEGKEKDVELVMGEIKRLLLDKGVLVLAVLSGEPEAGLPAVQLYTRQMFDRVTKNLQVLVVEMCDDVGCTGRSDYHIWYGVFEK